MVPKPDKARDNLAYSGSEGDLTKTGNDVQGNSAAKVNGYDVNPADPGESETKETYADIEDSVRCGYGSCKPDCLQVFNNPKMFLFILCWFSFLQGFIVNGVNNVNTASLERRFKLRSSQVGLISSAYDISAGIFVLPVTYFGTYAHQPRMLTVASVVMAFGSMVMFLPHFITGPYEYNSGAADVCRPGENVTTCVESDGLSNYLYVFMLGQFLHGYGGTVLYSVGIVFIDANVKTKDSPLYQGLLYCAAALGPAVGYLLGGALLNEFVDFDTVPTESLTITPNSVQWVGAWWVCFVASFCLLFCTVFFALMPYARELPTAKKIAKFRISQAHQDGAEKVASREKFGMSIKDLPMSLLLLLKNPVLMFATFASVTEGIVTSGFATFLAKFIQNQYGQTAAWSAILAGLVAVPGAAGGNVVGGLVTRCFNLKVRGMLRMNIFLCLLVVAICGVFFAKCPVTSIAGVSVPYNGTQLEQGTLDVNVDSMCNSDCGCSTASYDPVCGSDNIQYFSPCHAGCNTSHIVDGSVMFANCSCLLPSASTRGATEGVCSEATCWLLYLFLPCFFFIIFLTFMAAVPTVSITLRCIPDIQRSFAIGIQWVFIRALGTGPGPILFGFVFDRACQLWQDQCGENGACWIYNNHQLSINLAVLGMVVKFMSACFYSVAYCCYKPPVEESEEVADGSPTHASPEGTTRTEGDLATVTDGKLSDRQQNYLESNGQGVNDHNENNGITNKGFSIDEAYTGPALRDYSTAF